MARIFSLLLFVAAVFWSSGTTQAQTDKELVKKGQYIFARSRGLRVPHGS